MQKGPGLAVFNNTIKYTRAGALVSVSMPAISQTCIASPTIHYFQGPAIPARFRPSQTYIQSFGRVVNAGAQIQGLWIYDAVTFGFQIYTSAAQATFTASGTCGFSEFAVCNIIFKNQYFNFFFSGRGLLFE